MRKIIAQCQARDFAYLQTIADLHNNGAAKEAKRMANKMTKSQRAAMFILENFKEKGIPIEELQKIREALVWQYDDQALGVEYKLFKSFTEATLSKIRSISARNSIN